MKLLRLMLVLVVSCTMPACASWFKKGPKSSAKLYEGDESPHIKMYDEEQGPGSPVRN